jgi:hypothetical protein
MGLELFSSASKTVTKHTEMPLVKLNGKSEFEEGLTCLVILLENLWIS